MLTRLCNLPENKSFFLFGPRATGKTHLLRKAFPNALYLDLLNQKLFERLSENPQELETIIASKELVSSNSGAYTVLIDEVQLVPSLLNVVQTLMGTNTLQFGLTGSSARKLKRGNANLLGGRAFVRYLWPLSILELPKEFSEIHRICWGGLPLVALSKNNAEKIEYLRSYVNTYLNEEIVAEQLVRNLQPFRKFLRVAAQMSGKILNTSKIGRDIGVSHNTVQSYFEILEDTLIGFSLPAFETSERKRLRNKNKFYLFDTGVTRALARSLEQDVSDGTSAFGDLFEQCVVAEIKALCATLKPDWEMFYLQTAHGNEIDVLIDTGNTLPILIEIKSTSKLVDADVRGELELMKSIPCSQKIILSRDTLHRKLECGTQCIHWVEGLRLLFLQ